MGQASKEQTVKVKLLRLKIPDKYINAIKALRMVTGLGLKESKDIVDAMRRAPATPEVIINFTDQHDEDPFTAHFAYERISENLKLFKCTFSHRIMLILSENKSGAQKRAENLIGQTATNIKEITGPFNEGDVLANYSDFPFYEKS